jgi:GMP synthase (glutamine-hydrolysing)
MLSRPISSSSTASLPTAALPTASRPTLSRPIAKPPIAAAPTASAPIATAPRACSPVAVAGRASGRKVAKPGVRIPPTVARLAWVAVSVDDRPILLAIQHVPWETPHRILDACVALQVHTVKPLTGQGLPNHDEIAGAVVMGGPMNVDETDRHPELAAEREWLAEAMRRDMPVLGICLGAQLLARALGAEVRAGEGPELGFAPVEVLDSDDPLLGPLAPSTTALHWHGDAFELPEGAQHLARSEATEVQAFRYGNAWGVLFHPEADFALVEAWLAVPEMVHEACEALGDKGAAALPAEAEAAEQALIERTTPGLEAFAALVASHHRPA